MQSIKLNLSRTKLEAGEDWGDETVASLRAYIVAEIQTNHPDATLACVETGDEDHSSVGVRHQYSDSPYFAERDAELGHEINTAKFHWSDEHYCIWCSAYSARPMPGADSGPPAPGTKNSRGWKAVAAMHNPGCEWVATRDLQKKAGYGKYRVKIPAELGFEPEVEYTAKTLKSMRQIVAYATTDALLARRHGPDAVEDGVARICFDMSTRAISYSWADSTSEAGYDTRNEIPESAWKPAVVSKRQQ